MNKIENIKMYIEMFEDGSISSYKLVSKLKEIIIVPTCDMCGKLLTEGEHPNCCSDCWDENKEYYE